VFSVLSVKSVKSVLGHISDLHLRDDDDLAAFERQLDRIVARQPEHLAITGDLLDRWDPRLLERSLDALGARNLLDASRLTILHGNHDLASSGGHPRRTADLWRLAFRFWDPPPVVRTRRRRFYEAIERRAPGLASHSPFLKTLPSGIRIAVLDTVPLPWQPLRFSRGAIAVRHAIGCVRERELSWLRAQPRGTPLVLLVHHYPLDAPEFRWVPVSRMHRVIREVRVPMAIPAVARQRFWDAASAAGVSLVLCGHVHRARLEWKDGVAVGLNGQSGADWAGRTIAYYDLSGEPLEQICE
jgi:UDP-2,3-diacylglucosamine pyrophosphatase LpxH